MIAELEQTRGRATIFNAVFKRNHFKPAPEYLAGEGKGLTGDAFDDLPKIDVGTLVDKIILPASARAQEQSTLPIFFQRLGPYLAAWTNASDQRKGINLPLQLARHHSLAETQEYHLTSIISRMGTAGEMVRTMGILHNDNADLPVTAESERQRATQRLTRAAYWNLAFDYNPESREEKSSEVHRFLFQNNQEAFKKLWRTYRPPAQTSIQIRNDLARIAILAIQGRDGAARLDNDVLLYALSSTDTDTVNRAINLIGRRLDFVSYEDLVSDTAETIKELPFIPETERIWHNLTEKFLTAVHPAYFGDFFPLLAAKANAETIISEVKDISGMSELFQGIKIMLQKGKLETGNLPDMINRACLDKLSADVNAIIRAIYRGVFAVTDERRMHDVRINLLDIQGILARVK